MSPRVLVPALAVGLALSGIRPARPTAADAPGAPDDGRPAGLPLPSRVGVAAFEAKLFEFLAARRYAALGWHRDKGVRDTGPYLQGAYSGTHPAVRVYYSPGVVRWLRGGRVGPIPDGEVIVKEQYPAPAARHRGKAGDDLWKSLESWTVMVRDSAGSHDGWFWSNPAKGQCPPDPDRPPFDHPVSGFGLYCVRCHASTGTEYTFASLRNIEGFPGEPILFRVDDSWRVDRKAAAAGSHPECGRPKTADRPARRPDRRFLDFFSAVRPVPAGEVVPLPPVTRDPVPFGPAPGRGFATSDQCMSCHAGLTAPFGPTMFLPAGKDIGYGAAGRDVSPFGEWRWTPMGLAGRDPVFHAQLAVEQRLIDREFGADPARAGTLRDTLADTCLKCHGTMGRHDHAADRPGEAGAFSLAHVHAAGGHPDARYGGLARDGVSCLVCHRMRPPEQPPGDRRPYLQFFLEAGTTGNLHFGPPGEVYGPFKDDEIAPHAMERATGHKPRHGEFLKSSRLCGTCHTVALPAVDHPSDPATEPDEVARSQADARFRGFHHHVEQATYLEWLNSEYGNEFAPANPRAKTCQDCHMAKGVTDDALGLDVPEVRTRIAAIQDATYPEAENLAPHAHLDVRVRESGYRRHNFAGLNAFLLEMFRQSDDVLGVRTTDFMTGSADGLPAAVRDMARTAREDTADVSVTAAADGPGRLAARVTVRNKAGHRFPTGVAFRRAFLELTVADGDRVVWASGRTDELGVLVGADGRPLPTEFFDRDPATGRQRFQPHHQEITSPDQVQVYETLVRNARGEFTTSFVRGCETAKDNRLLPRGWTPGGPGPALAGRFLQATHPDPAAAADPRYADGSGSDEVTYRIALPAGADPARLRVRATLYYQALPPYFLRAVFEAAPDAPAVRRLHHVASRLDLRGTPVEGWKLRVAAAECRPAP